MTYANGPISKNWAANISIECYASTVAINFGLGLDSGLFSFMTDSVFP